MEGDKEGKGGEGREGKGREENEKEVGSGD